LGLLYALCWTIGWVLHILIYTPSYIEYTYKRFCEQRTISSLRLGWMSLQGFPDSQTHLLSEARHSSSRQTTSQLCQGCFERIEQSYLLAGSVSIFTYRTEWCQWSIPLRGSEFMASRRLCHLCNILWYSLDEQKQRSLAGPLTPRRQLPNTNPPLWVPIWKGQTGRYYISLFDKRDSQPKHKLFKEIEIREGWSYAFLLLVSGC
jgi:hypothetical protein